MFKTRNDSLTRVPPASSRKVKVHSTNPDKAPSAPPPDELVGLSASTRLSGPDRNLFDGLRPLEHAGNRRPHVSGTRSPGAHRSIARSGSPLIRRPGRLRARPPRESSAHSRVARSSPETIGRFHHSEAARASLSWRVAGERPFVMGKTSLKSAAGHARPDLGTAQLSEGTLTRMPVTIFGTRRT
jgi:hypothetical protein